MIEAVQQGLAAEGCKVSIAKLYKWFEVPRRSFYYKSFKAAPQVQE